MSSAAYQFGRIKFWMFVLIFSSAHLSVENNNKYSIFKIQAVQINELPRTLEKIVAYLIMFYHMYVWGNEISPHPTFPLS